MSCRPTAQLSGGVLQMPSLAIMRDINTRVAAIAKHGFDWIPGASTGPNSTPQISGGVLQMPSLAICNRQCVMHTSNGGNSEALL